MSKLEDLKPNATVRGIVPESLVTVVAAQWFGSEPAYREREKLGYDIENQESGTGRLRFLEVKGRATGAATITVTRPGSNHAESTDNRPTHGRNRPPEGGTMTTTRKKHIEVALPLEAINEVDVAEESMMGRTA